MRHLLIVLLSLLLSSAFAHSDKHSLGDEADAIKAAGKTYHQNVSVIRKMHPEFLNHKRDKTSRQGIRTKENSLKGCVNCHVSKNQATNIYHSINTKDQFCSTCHQQVSVSIDCFGCHRSAPGQATIQKKILSAPLLPNTSVVSATISKQNVISAFFSTATAKKALNKASIDNKEVSNE